VQGSGRTARALAAGIVCAALAAGCHQAPALLLSVTADAPAQLVDLYLQEEQSHKVIFHSGFNAAVGLDPSGVLTPIDLTATPLKIAVSLSATGRYKILVVGAIGALDGGKPSPDGQLFWAGHVDVGGARQVEAHLLTVPSGDDADRDLWPDSATFLADVPQAQLRYASMPELLDCDDKTDDPPGANGRRVMLRADQINPFAPEVCGDGYDEACDGDANEPCVDQDGDGDPNTSDCDDHDATRHTPTAADPFPDPPNCCGYSLGKDNTPDANKNFAGDPVLCPRPRCGDGIDESCRGSDTPCQIDQDCDGYPAGVDCDDTRPDIHPGAVEICNNGVNESCNEHGADQGCVPCDLDGDGYQRDDASSGCPDATNQHPGQADCDDDDAGVHPGATSSAGGKEGGVNAQGKLATALKGLCRTIYEPKGMSGTAKVGVAGYAIGDADCNKIAFEGCPPASCDADGDGWPKDACGALALPGPYDCNDNDPTIFPSAPDVCGDGIDGSCAGVDTPCAGMDKDGDGYLPPADCDDNNPNVHPFAIEKCNGADDDCDGDVDEGNPDPSGAALVVAGALASCTDSNIGECGKQKGYCVCSPTTPLTAINAGARLACAGEDAGGMRRSHCFGAGQPHPQTCTDALDRDDDCDGRLDAPDGKNLLIKGLPCGLAQGQCKPGLVIACLTTPTKTWYGTPPPAGKAHWECSPDTVASVPEACNGFDDDCDGVVPADETDPDLDKFMACSPCPPPLASGVSACGDCGPNDPNTHPGASELCDGVDNNCDGQVDEAPNPCTALGKTCCAAQGGACQNLMNDDQYCGACNVSCLTSVSGNKCSGGNCICKNDGVPCDPGTWCNPANSGGTCEYCDTDHRCTSACIDCATQATCSAGMLSGVQCSFFGDSCIGTANCPGDYACANATTCKTNCASDADCRGSRWCKKGAGGQNTCVSRIGKHNSCSDSDCATAGCLQCTAGGGSACPGTQCP
jgi:hypothetical protein